VAGLLLAGHTAVLAINVGRSWRQATASLPVIVVCAVTAVVVACAAGWAGSRLTAEPSPPPVPSGARTALERVAWSGEARNRWAWPAAAALAWAVVASQAMPRLLIGLLVSVILVLFSQVLVVAGPRGVTIALGVWRWPRRHFALATIVSTRPVELSALACRGWGLRRVPHGRALIIRSGDALQLDLADGRRFIVTVDRAGEAAALVNDYIAVATANDTSG
jgi:hypothetical protein